MRLLTSDEISSFHTLIFSWWEKNRRDLPWRHTHDPYNILVSELMLQQTQVLRVIPKYAEFVEAYPTVHSLASASTADVLRLWKGMGYNRRALYLKSAAKTVMETHGGKFPETEAALLALPGIGRYTARAILVFAFQQDVAMVDTNIRQIITHFFYNDIPQSESVIQGTADQLIPKGKSWDWHQALMDYGSAGLSSVIPDKPRAKSRGAIRDPIGNQHSAKKKSNLVREDSPQPYLPNDPDPRSPSKPWRSGANSPNLPNFSRPSDPSRPPLPAGVPLSGTKEGHSPQSSLPFIQTNRFFRGRIIDRLREGNAVESELIAVMMHTYEKPYAFIVEILEGLARDGLLVRSKNGIISLPE